MRPHSKIRKTIVTGAALLSGWIFLISGMADLFDTDTTLGIQPAAANTQYGILGQPAPELELNTWIDGNGKPMDPVKLRDYRGKVIYLYFFQDW
jgi:hypothetical protein